MTSMPNSGFGQYPGEQPFVEQRTSVMAILSLVCALTCIPAAFGALFGIGGLVAISRSNGRLTGRGLAIAGLILSLIFVALQAGIGLGAGRVWQLFKQEAMTPAAETMAAIDKGDYATARGALSPEAAKQITDADFDAFRDAYQGELGKFVSVPTTVMALVNGYTQINQQMQQFSGRNDAFPLPAEFEKGTALLVFQVVPGSQNNRIVKPSVNIMVIAPSGNKWTLYDPQRGVVTPPKPTGPKPGDVTPPPAPEPKTGPG